jgi:hypothetical protein
MIDNDLPKSLSALIEAGITAILPKIKLHYVEVDQKTSDDSNFGSNVFKIQGLITTMCVVDELVLQWPEKLFNKVGANPNSFPLLACSFLHTRIRHQIASTETNISIAAIRKKIEKTRIGFDWFSEPQSLLCADHLGLGRPHDLYLSQSATGIRPRDDFEELVFPYIERQLAVDLDSKKAFHWRAAFASVIYELFENTELHGKTGIENSVLQTSIRGILFRDVPFQLYQPTNRPTPTGARCIEVSIFDSGVGYFQKSQRRELDKSIPLLDEWKVLHECLSVHLDEVTATKAGKGFHGIGLYEVLRALKFLEGAIEIRSGRLHGYRSFLPGDLLVQMESADSKLRPGMPKATLLDFERKYVSQPTENPQIVGSALRILIPII